MSPRILAIIEVRFFKPGCVPDDVKKIDFRKSALWYDRIKLFKGEHGFRSGYTQKWWDEFGPDEGRTVAAWAEVL